MKGKKMTAKERKEKMECDAGERRKVFKELCDHIRGGYSMDCFGPLGLDSIRLFIKLYPFEFVQDELDLAVRDGKSGWENIGRRQSDGNCLGNSRSWFYNMANRYGWRDKVDIDADVKGAVNVNVVSYASTKARTDAMSDDAT